MTYISLGPTCSVAYQLQKLEKKKESLPFDWIRCPNIKDVIYLITNNFQGFLDNISFVRDDTKFPIIRDSEIFDDVLDRETKVYRNEKLNLGFFHDFKDGVTLEDVKEKYDRRIKRFYETVKNECIFIRDDMYFNQESVDDYNNLYQILVEFNDQNKLVLIININKNKYDLSGLNPAIKVFVDNEKQTEWQHHKITSFIELL
jgi:hypothetical protein